MCEIVTTTGVRARRMLDIRWVHLFGLSMNRYERRPQSGGEAELQYLDGEYRIVRPGAFVRCGVTGRPIALDELRYWSVDLQEAYSGPESILVRMGAAPKA